MPWLQWGLIEALSPRGRGEIAFDNTFPHCEGEGIEEFEIGWVLRVFLIDFEEGFFYIK